MDSCARFVSSLIADTSPKLATAQWLRSSTLRCAHLPSAGGNVFRSGLCASRSSFSATHSPMCLPIFSILLWDSDSLFSSVIPVSSSPMVSTRLDDSTTVLSRVIPESGSIDSTRFSLAMSAPRLAMPLTPWSDSSSLPLMLRTRMFGMRHALPPMALRPFFWCFPRCLLSGRSFSPPPPPTSLACPSAHGASPAPPRPQLARLSHLSCSHSAMAAMDARSETTLSPRSSLPRFGHPLASDESTRDTPFPFRSSATPPPFSSANAASRTGMSSGSPPRPPIRDSRRSCRAGRAVRNCRRHATMDDGETRSKAESRGSSKNERPCLFRTKHSASQNDARLGLPGKFQSGPTSTVAPKRYRIDHAGPQKRPRDRPSRLTRPRA